ncbi:MAG: MarR family winged helix-turn-helix transcriptional regulator [Candidatus Binatia bacterium]
MPQDAEIDTANEILRSIRRIVRRISEQSRLMSRDVGITLPQLLCLKAIGELEEAEDEVTVVMVGKRVHLAPATVSRIVERLVNAGMVNRERRSKDRRKVCLSLTDLGLERFQTLPTPFQETFVQRLAKLDRNERDALLDSLRRLTQLMEAEDLDAAPVLVPGSDVKDSS